MILGRERTLKLYRCLTMIWILLLLVLPVLLTGRRGFLCGALLLLFAREKFRNILALQLKPEQRVLQMKGIVAANVFGNGALIVTLLAAVLMEALHA